MDDYIKRKNALDLIESAGALGWSKNQMYEEMQKVPAADVESVVHARWIWQENAEDFYCSACYEWLDVPIYSSDSLRQRARRCRYCGAKMDLDEG